MEDISLAWDTFDFYASLISKKEGVFEKMTNRSHEFLSTSKISDRNKAYLKEIINAENKKALVIGAGGVSPSVIFSLQKSKVSSMS